IVPFLVMQVRTALYPSLEEPWNEGGWLGGVFGYAAAPPPQQAAVGGEMMMHRGLSDVAENKKQVLASVGARVKGEAEFDLAEKPLPYPTAPDPKSIVQTGPGLPDWTGRTVPPPWGGPVKQGQQMRLILIPPAANRLLTLLRVGLVAILVLCLFGFPERSL